MRNAWLPLALRSQDRGSEHTGWTFSSRRGFNRRIAIPIPSAFLTAETGPPLPTARLLLWIHGPYSPLAMDFISVQIGVHVRREGEYKSFG